MKPVLLSIVLTFGCQPFSLHRPDGNDADRRGGDIDGNVDFDGDDTFDAEDGDQDSNSQLESLGDRLCTDDDFCWVNPLPCGTDFTDIWGTSNDNVWITGDSGMLLHWDGSEWSWVDTSTDVKIHTLWGSGPDDIWLGPDSGPILHYNGENIGPNEDLGVVWGIWGSGPNDVWAVGSSIHHWNGEEWEEFESEFLNNYPNRIDGLGAHDVWIASRSEVAHFDGEGFTIVYQQDSSLITDIAVAPSGVYIVEELCIKKWDGHTFTTLDNSCLNSSYTSHQERLWVDGEQIYVAGYEFFGFFNDKTWHINPDMARHITGFWGESGSRPWIVGHNGHHARPNGHGWDQHDDLTDSLRAVVATGRDQAWVGGDALYRCDPDTCEVVDIGLSGDNPTYDLRVVAMWGNDGSNVWAVAVPDRPEYQNSTIFLFDGSVWGQHLIQPKIKFLPRVISGTSNNNVWIAGRGTELIHWNGLEWMTHTLTNSIEIKGIVAFSEDDVWAIGSSETDASHDENYLLHFDGVEWSWNHIEELQEPDFTPQALGGTSHADLWVMDRSGSLAHFGGEHWQVYDTEFSWYSQATVYARAPDDVWFAGRSLVHYDGIGFHEMARGAKVPLSAVHGTSSSIWAVGTGGRVLLRQSEVE